MTAPRPLPPADRRRFRRVRLQPGELGLAPGAGEPGAGARWRALDLGPEGVALASPEPLRWPERGVRAALVTAAASVPCRAFTAHQRGAADGSWVVGLRLEADGPDRRVLAAAYHRRRFPALLRRGEAAAEEVAELFRRSGYLALKEGVAPSPAWLSAAWPDSLTREALYRADDTALLGHIAVTRAYGQAWLGHEIATRRDHDQAMECRRALYQHFATWPRLLDGERAMVFGYYNLDRPWHRRMFEAFAAEADPERESLVLPMDRFVARFDDAPEPDTTEPGAAVEVRPFVAADLEAAHALIASHWPSLARRAFDVDGGPLELGCLHAAYAEAGVERLRRAFTLRSADGLTGLALCEWTSADLSLFGVLNCAHIFFRGKDAAVPRAARQALVRHVGRFFRERGVRSPLVIAPPGTLPPDEALGLRLAETMGCIVWSSAGLRRYEDYVDRVLAPARA